MTVTEKQNEIKKLNEEMFNRIDEIDSKNYPVLKSRQLSRIVYNEIGDKVNEILKK
jgi:hypothetical protein